MRNDIAVALVRIAKCAEFLLVSWVVVPARIVKRSARKCAILWIWITTGVYSEARVDLDSIGGVHIETRDGENRRVSTVDKMGIVAQRRITDDRQREFIQSEVHIPLHLHLRSSYL
jgi:hypothetical protein